MDRLAIVLTARLGSTRLSNKALADVAGKPLLEWIIRRLQPLGDVIVATTTGAEDKPLLELAQRVGVPAYAGACDDVVGRMDKALNQYCPTADYVLRGLGDMPFLATELVARAVKVLSVHDGDALCWHLAPYCWPVYGAREFPYSRSAWSKIVARSKEREHVDSYFHKHRNAFKVLFHEAPSNIYFRPYRLEVDWHEDLALIRAIGEHVGMLAGLQQIIHYLDSDTTVAHINKNRVEQTGPTCYTYEEQRAWTKHMTGKPVIGWDDNVWMPPSPRAQVVFCAAGSCFLGFAEDGVLHTKVGRVLSGRLDCGCGSGLTWNTRR